MPLLFHTFSIAKHWYVFDANKNSVISIDENKYNALSEIEQGVITQENTAVLREFQENGFCEEAVIHKIYNPDTDIIAAHLEKKIQFITIQVTQNCNLRCDYCPYSGGYKNRPHAAKSISDETAKKAIDMALRRSEDSRIFGFAFYGGEPLLELPLIKKCVEYIKQRAPNREFIFTTTTNGTLLTPDVFEYLANNGFSVTVSLDGPKQIHDASRKFANGKGSYDVIMRNIQYIRERYPEFSDKLRFNAVLSTEIDFSCLPQLFKSDDVLSYYAHTASLVSDMYNENKVFYSDAFSLSFEHELCKLLLSMLGKIEKEHVSVLVSQQEAEYQYTYQRLKKIPRIHPECHPGGPCLAGVMRLFVDVNGRFFPCERVSENSETMMIGDLDNGFDYEKIKTLLNPAQVTEDECKKCWVINHCSLCAAASDDMNGLSRSVRLSNCKQSRNVYENRLKTICFLKESGYIFKN